MLNSKAASQEAAIAFPDAGALGGPRGFPRCLAELCRTSGSREHQDTARAQPWPCSSSGSPWSSSTGVLGRERVGGRH